MRSRAVVMACLFGCVVSARADLVITTAFEHSTLLQNEPVRVVVGVENEEDQAFVVPAEDTELDLMVTRANGDTVQRLMEGHRIVVQLNVKPGGREDFMVDVGDWYDLYTEGRYVVTVTATWSGRRYSSASTAIEVVRGLEISSESRSIRGYPDRRRTYSLRYWARERREYLFLMTEEKDGARTTFDLGPVIRYYKPEMTLDRDGALTVYHQSGPDRFTRSLFKVDAREVQFVDQSYFAADGKPYGKSQPTSTEGITNAPPAPPTAPEPPVKKRRRSLLSW